MKHSRQGDPLDALWEKAVVMAFGRGETVFHRGDTVSGLWRVQKGTLRLFRVLEDGQELLLYRPKSGDIIAEASMFAEQYGCSLSAVSECELQFVNKPVVLGLLRQDHETAERFMALMGHHIMRLRTRLEVRNIRSARERVLKLFQIEANADGVLTLSGSLKDIAAEIGLSHEAFYRALAQLEAAELIERRPGQIVVRSSP